MDHANAPPSNRRGFLKDVSVALASLPLVAASPGAERAPLALAKQKAEGEGAVVPPVPSIASGYQALSLEEAAFTEALVNHMWPADDLTPSGVELGIATFIDRQLAGAFGQGDRLYSQGPFRTGKPQHGYQLPLTPAEYYKAGLQAASDACRKRYGTTVERLEPAQRESFLLDLASGKASEGPVDLAVWFNSLVYPLFERGAFSDPLYGGNRDKLAWKMIGYPGLPATYALDVLRYRGKPHPFSANPRSIQDFS